MIGWFCIDRFGTKKWRLVDNRWDSVVYFYLRLNLEFGFWGKRRSGKALEEVGFGVMKWVMV